MLNQRFTPRHKAVMKSAICLIVRNEARDIAEWIAFHALLGFDALIIFDNDSDDGTDEVIKAAGRLYDIRLHPWPGRAARTQLAAYEAACAAYRLEFDWIAFLDSDEFLLPEQDEPINTLLARFAGWSGIAVNWAIFGANGHDALPDGLITESFTRRADTSFFPTLDMKSCLNPHCFDLRGGRLGSYCAADGTRLSWLPAPEHGGALPGVTMAPPSYAACRVNHYFTRSRAHWRAKMRRGYPSDIATRHMAEFDEYDRNDIEDRSALRYLPDLRMDVARIEAKLPVSLRATLLA